MAPADHPADLRGKDGAALIDTDVIDVYLLTGEYDWSATPKISQKVRITIVELD